MNYLIDTNILLSVVRSKDYKGFLNFLNLKNSSLYISIVTEAEIKSIGLRNQWSTARLGFLDFFLTQINIIDVNQILLATYVQIDAYSQRSNPSFTDYPFNTHRNMGKNDLWIASVAAIMNLTLITTDADFDHLNGVFFEVKKINAKDFLPFFK
jgi:tRNA(fMet)-specific endonuclease VapC